MVTRLRTDQTEFAENVQQQREDQTNTYQRNAMQRKRTEEEQFDQQTNETEPEKVLKTFNSEWENKSRRWKVRWSSLTEEFVCGIEASAPNLRVEGIVSLPNNSFECTTPIRNLWDRNWTSKSTREEWRKPSSFSFVNELVGPQVTSDLAVRGCYRWETPTSAKWRNPMFEHFCRFYRKFCRIWTIERSAIELLLVLRLTLVFVRSLACSNRERRPAEVLASTEGNNNAIWNDRGDERIFFAFVDEFLPALGELEFRIGDDVFHRNRF